ncbi:MAG TPA: DNA primase [Pusillimonas sp.]|jgi:putative DNA primase/helicase|nr:DNA primase [Pusillimonas sp.]|tara:strand:+ start:226 stop:1524 length:1299 start_codon:yes stop_codon:yes gene_type:complete
MSAQSKTKFHLHAFVEYAVKQHQYAREADRLYRWNGTFWSLISDEQMEREVYRWLVENHRMSATPEAARRARAAILLFVSPLPVQPTTTVLPCLNGYVHIDASGIVLRRPEPELGLRYLINCGYNPKEQPPVRFNAFLETALPDPSVRARVQEYIGYTLMPDARYQRAQFWLGKGANGKGVLQEIVSALHRKSESVFLDRLDGFRLSELVGASLICCDEAPRGRIDEQVLKSLIAGEPVQIDRKYRDPVSSRIQAKWLVSGNHMPRITDHSVGFWRRWDIVPFEVVVPAHQRQTTLAKQIIENELAGVLNWALEGLLRLQRRGGFDMTLPESMANLLKRARQETDPLSAWLEECVTVSASAQTNKGAVYDGYRTWCLRNGVQALSSPHFWPRLRDIVPSLVESRPRIDGTPTRRCNLALRQVTPHALFNEPN